MSRKHVQIGWTTETLDQHLADQARARRRRNCELTHRNVDRWSGKTKARDNRAAGKRDAAREVWA